MHIHILGICGTFMAGIAKIAKELGHDVTGQDESFYPPMSQLLEKLNIKATKNYDLNDLPKDADCYIVGNAMKRGMPAVEFILENKLPMISGPEWLNQYVLKNKRVIAISGTHGKTTTSSLVTHILETAGLNPSFLIGGAPLNFDCSARWTDSEWFVIEADEYDTAFFDKRSKFIHYFPEILSINNLEYDHADIFKNIDDIIFQFHCLVRLIPKNGCIIYPSNNPYIQQVLDKGLWSQAITVNDLKGWHIEHQDKSPRTFDIFEGKKKKLSVQWKLIGEHNESNALIACVICQKIGIDVEDICTALSTFRSVKRRLQIVAQNDEVTLYDDFAHHPSSIQLTLNGLKKTLSSNDKLIAILDFASYTMRKGVHAKKLASALSVADEAILIRPQFEISDLPKQVKIVSDTQEIAKKIDLSSQHLHIVMMSNRSVETIKEQLVRSCKLKQGVDVAKLG